MSDSRDVPQEIYVDSDGDLVTKENMFVSIDEIIHAYEEQGYTISIVKLPIEEEE